MKNIDLLFDVLSAMPMPSKYVASFLAVLVLLLLLVSTVAVLSRNYSASGLDPPSNPLDKYLHHLQAQHVEYRRGGRCYHYVPRSPNS